MAFLSLALIAGSAGAQSPAARLFDGHTDIGAVGKKGAEFYDPIHGAYMISGGGANMWSTNDAFHFVWTRMTGSVAIAADIAWPEPGGNAHRKACLMIRQSLDAHSPYVDAAVHGNGLTSLQFRDRPGGDTREIQSNVSGPSRVRLEKRGEVIAMSLARPGGRLAPAGGSFKHGFTEPFYVGLAVCAHDNAVLEQAVFSGLELTRLPPPVGNKTALESTIETVDIGSKDRRVVHVVRDRLEAPNWSPDGHFLLFNQRGRLYRIPVEGGRPVLLNTGFAIRCNNWFPHPSPDGKWLVFLSYAAAVNGHPENQDVILRLMPLRGGPVQELAKLFGGQGTINVPSWSPDSRRLAYVSYRLVYP